MLKGIQKNMMLIRLPKGKYFEEAYFVMRSASGDKDRQNHGEMVKEANRIIGEMELSRLKGKGAKKERGRAFWFWIGTLVGSVAVALVWLITLLML